MKLTSKQFFAILRENGGLFQKTAEAIKKQYNIDISRQGVRDRALKRPDILADIEESMIDVAEEGLHTLMKTAKASVKLNAIKLYLTTRGRSRGYQEKQIVELENPDILKKLDSMSVEEIEALTLKLSQRLGLKND